MSEQQDTRSGTEQAVEAVQLTAAANQFRQNLRAHVKRLVRAQQGGQRGR